MNPPTQKLIFKGRLEFGNQRTYDMVLKHWQTRLETYFKSDILFKSEQVFLPEDFALCLGQQTLQSTEKHWRSTTALLQELSQYAIAGVISAWRMANGQVLDSAVIEPLSEKAAVTEYKRGCELVAERGKENEATAALNRAIEKYERHAAAYERRGYVNYKLGNFKDAMYDFSKSIDINPTSPDAYYGRAKVKMLKNDWEGAVQDFEFTLKRALALQPIFWLARLKKGICLVYLKRFQEAEKELQSYVQRAFSESDPNYSRRPRAWLFLGKALLGNQQINAALDAFLKARALSAAASNLSENETQALDRVIEPSFKRDLEAAAKVDVSHALALLEI